MKTIYKYFTSYHASLFWSAILMVSSLATLNLIHMDVDNFYILILHFALGILFWVFWRILAHRMIEKFKEENDASLD